MPYIRRQLKQSGGPQYWFNDASKKLRPLAEEGTEWRVYVKRPDGKYVHSKLLLKLKEGVSQNKDLIASGHQGATNIISLILRLYSQNETAVHEATDIRFYVDIDSSNIKNKTIFLTPTSYRLDNDSFSLSRSSAQPPSSRKRRIRKRELSNLPSFPAPRKLRRAVAYTVELAESPENHEFMVAKLQQRIKDNTSISSYTYGRQDVDCYAYYQGRHYFFEIKTGADIDAKARYAVGQLLQYKFFYTNQEYSSTQYPDPYLCVVLDKPPYEDVIEFLRYTNMLVCWIEEDTFACPPYCRRELSFLFENGT